MKALLIIVAIAAALGVGGLALWLVGIRRAFEAVGAPTPESARVKIETAEEKAKKQNAAAIEEVTNATKEEKLRRARARVQRGLRGNE